MSLKHLIPPQSDFINSCFTTRQGEKRLGERILLATQENYLGALANPEITFVLLGIPEDIGVRANHGVGGTAQFWPAFLNAFLSVQSNAFLTGECILLAGEINCADLMENSSTLGAEELSKRVAVLDQRVMETLVPILNAGKIPVVIGGGHNNAYPLLKAAHLSFGKKLSVLNIDPHADLRLTDRRHSGNGFSFAKDENIIHQYTQIGLHENYNNQFILDEYKNNAAQLHYFTYDDFLDGKWSLNDIETYVKENYSGCVNCFELDADSVLNLPSSAVTPSGFSVEETRRLIKLISRLAKPVYFHFPEAKPETAPINTAKLATYFVTDFMKAFLKA